MSSTNLPTTMKAWLFSSTTNGMEKNLALNPSAPSPVSTTPLKPGQCLVSVTAMSLNPVDYKLIEFAGSLIHKYPASPGIDFSGTIVSTTSTDPSLRPGTSVFGQLGQPIQFGTLAQFTVSPEQGTIPLPSGVDPLQAAAMGTAGLTAYQCIAPNVKSGDKVFINGGSGGTGTFGIQIAKNLGCHVTTSCSTPNISLCKSLGADEVIDYKSSDLTTTLKEGGPRFALVVDNVGSPTDLYAQSHHFLLKEGKYVQIGIETSISAVANLLGRMFRPTVLGGGKRGFQLLQVKNDREGSEKLGQWIKEGKLKSVIEETYEWKDAPKAYERLRLGRTRGKIVVKVAE